MSKRYRERAELVGLIAVFTLAWFVVWYAVLSGLPPQTRDIIGTLSLGSLPLVFISGLKLGTLQAHSHREGFDQALKLKQSGSRGRGRYNPKQPAPDVDLTAVINSKRVPVHEQKDVSEEPVVEL